MHPGKKICVFFVDLFLKPVGGQLSLSGVFRQRNFARLPIDRGGGRIHQPLDALILSRSDNVDEANDILHRRMHRILE